MTGWPGRVGLRHQQRSPGFSGRLHWRYEHRDCGPRIRAEHAIADTIRGLDRARVLVGISGYGGSGKTILGRALAGVLDCPVVAMDAFGTTAVFQRSTDWHGFDRVRLQEQVLKPFSSGCPKIRYDACDDWESWTSAWVERQVGRFLVVEGVGLFHPDLLRYLDYRIWLDVPLRRATAQGIARERALGRFVERLWRSTWEPNERDFERAFEPRQSAHRLVRPVP